VNKSIHEIKEIVQNKQIQAVGLSCTHYPLILPMLQAAMPGIVFIGPSEAVVQEVVRVLRLE
jgi:glutamate racemase